MNVTTGIDIIEVKRIQKAIFEGGDSFLNRIYTDKEIVYCQKSNAMKYQHFAARFAAKEAVFKALSGHIDSQKDSFWKEIEIINNKEGKPSINLELLKIKGIEGIKNIDISISHIKDYAVASVVVLWD